MKFKEMEVQPNGLVSGRRDLETKLTEMLEIVVLPEESGVHEQCIYIVPPKIRQANPKAYTPQVVSIGPFHNPRGSGMRDNILEPMEELKLKYLKAFLSRTTVSTRQFVLKLEELESRIRSCYAGPINYNNNDFLEMILIDACFIIELFLRYRETTDWENSCDPILSKKWLAIDIENDLFLLENQLPFFLLEEIYNLACRTAQSPSSPSFLEIIFKCFTYYNKQNISPEGVCPKHFTDLLRTFMLPPSFVQGTTEEEKKIRHLYSATQLSEAGLVFKVSQQSKSLLNLEYQEGVLTMPCFEVHDTTEIYLRNVLAFEECQYRGKRYIAQYFTILHFLINTEKDVNLLVDKKIIVNWMGDAYAVATMVNNLCKHICMPHFNPKYFNICKSLNGFYENPRNKYKAIFIHEYFNTPWKIASTIAAVLLLLLTLIQTICSVISLA